MKLFISTLVVLLSVSSAFAEENTYSDKTSKGHAVGKADDQAATSQRATDITRMIREKIMADSSLSVKAQNIQIMTDNKDRVILKGNVASAGEKQKVESIAKSVAGQAQVINNTVVTK